MVRSALFAALKGILIGVVATTLFGAVLVPSGMYLTRLVSGEGLTFEAAGSRVTTDTPITKIASSEETRVAGRLARTELSETEITDQGPDHFDVNVAMVMTRDLAELGPRVAGSDVEHEAFDLLEERLETLGYLVARQTVPIPGGVSYNLIVERAGRTNRVLVLGAHVDSKDPSPGANDNASGCGVVYALAKSLKEVETDATIRFIFFGAEEVVGSKPDDHHFGSRHYVSLLSQTEKDRIAGMLSVDMVGYGTSFVVRTMQKGPQTMMQATLDHADLFEYPLTFLKDEGSAGWSDYEAFEHAGIPAAWVEWRDDPYYHTERDVYSHVSSARVRTTGELLAGLAVMLTEDDLLALQE